MANGRSSACTTAKFQRKTDAPPDEPLDAADSNGIMGSFSAVKHGISKALVYQEPELRDALKAAGFMTRDSRVVERKKYDRAKARRSFQFSKP